MYIARYVLCGPRENRVAEEIILVHKQLCYSQTTQKIKGYYYYCYYFYYYHFWTARLNPCLHMRTVSHLVQMHFVQNNK